MSGRLLREDAELRGFVAGMLPVSDADRLRRATLILDAIDRHLAASQPDTLPHEEALAWIKAHERDDDNIAAAALRDLVAERAQPSRPSDAATAALLAMADRAAQHVSDATSCTYEGAAGGKEGDCRNYPDGACYRCATVEYLDARRARRAPQPSNDTARVYPCDDCGKMRTKAEGGTVFTVCEACWEKHYGKPRSGPSDDTGTYDARCDVCECPRHSLSHAQNLRTPIPARDILLSIARSSRP